MDDKFEALKPDEVVSLGKDWKQYGDMFYLPPTFKSRELHNGVVKCLEAVLGKNFKETREKLFNDGLDGEVLTFGANGWQKGTIRFRVTVEFCPEETEEVETEKTQETEQSETSEESETNQIEANNFDSLDDLRREFNQES
ncbi:MAG: hypothetical protein F6K35_17750 [Okeania sp. SIO2H7]|nr:hypothetical protein [Okeania sp. SIO2H7]